MFQEAIEQNSEVKYLEIKTIRSNPYQPRKVFDAVQLEELASSIKEYGIMQPVIVRRTGDYYELVAGERRLRASKLAGKSTIPAIIVETTERDSAFLALMENLQRENLNFLEEAEGYLNLMHDYGLTQEEVAAKLGKSQSNIANKIRVLRLPDSVKNLLRDNGLTERHARALLKLPDEKSQLKVAQKIVIEAMNVKRTDAYVESVLKRMKAQARKSGKDSKNFKLYIKDSKIYINTIKKSVDLITQAGGDAEYVINDLEDCYQVVVNIKKNKQ